MVRDLRNQRKQADSRRWRPRLVGDANAPLWARFYHLETGRPLFVDRDGLPRDSYNDLSAERRSGYAYVGNWGRCGAQLRQMEKAPASRQLKCIAGWSH